jgi:tetratricopeptide (TPR) repeat protein
MQGSAQAAYNAGITLSELGELTRALEMQDLALRYQPLFPEPRYSRAALLADRAGQRKRALEDLILAEGALLTEKLIAIDPDGVAGDDDDDDDDDGDDDGDDGNSGHGGDGDAPSLSRSDDSSDIDELIRLALLPYSHPELGALQIRARRESNRPRGARGQSIEALLHGVNERLNHSRVEDLLPAVLRDPQANSASSTQVGPMSPARRNLLSKVATLRAIVLSRIGGERSLLVAGAILRRVMWEDGSYYHAFVNFGNICKKLGRPFLALSVLRATSEIFPGDTEPFTAYGSVLVDTRSYNSSFPVLTRAVQLENSAAGADAAKAGAVDIYAGGLSIAFCHLFFARVTAASWAQWDHAKAVTRIRRIAELQVSPAQQSNASSIGDIATSTVPVSAWFPSRSARRAASRLRDSSSKGGDGSRPMPPRLQRNPGSSEAVSCVHPFAALSYPLPTASTLRIAVAHAAQAASKSRGLRARPFYPAGTVSLAGATADDDAAAADAADDDDAAAAAGDGSISSPSSSPKQLTDRADRRIRIALISSEFRNHPLTMLVKPLLVSLNRTRFAATLYALTADDRGVGPKKSGGSGKREREDLVARAARFVDVSTLSTADVAQRIYDDGTDIIVNLDGYTSENERPELYALRPAPVIMSFMGYAGSLGDAVTDYIVTDRRTTPPRAQAFFSEKFLLMPDSYYLNNYRAEFAPGLPEAPGVPQGVAEAPFVFANFCRSVKIDPFIFRLWMRILRAVPGSVLWLMSSPIESEAALLDAADDLRRSVLRCIWVWFFGLSVF